MLAILQRIWRDRRGRRRLCFALALVLYTLLGFLVAPALIKWQLVKQLPALTHRDATVETVRVNPYTLSLTVRGLTLKEKSGEDFAALGEFYVNFQLSSIFKRAWVFKEIRLDAPFANIVLASNGVPNFANLLSPPDTNAPPATNAAVPRVDIGRLAITNAVIAFTDFGRSNVFHAQVKPINLVLTNFTTRVEENSPYAFVATTDTGAMLAWSGHVTVTPVRSAGHLLVTGVPLQKYAPYLDDYMNARVADGLLSLTADYSFAAARGAMGLSASNASVSLTNLRFVAPTTGEELATIGKLAVSDTTLDVPEKQLRVGGFALADAHWLARRYPAESTESTRLLDQSGRQAIQELFVKLNRELGWALAVNAIRLTNIAVTLEDVTMQPPPRVEFRDIAISVDGLSNTSNAPIQLALSVASGEQSLLVVTGRTSLLPLTADLFVSGRTLDLRPFAPYLRQVAAINLTSGLVDVEHNFRYGMGGADESLLRAQGNFALSDFAASETINAHELVSFHTLALRGIDVALWPDRFHADELLIDRFKGTIIVGEDGKLNVLSLVNHPATNSAPPAATAPPPAAPKPLPDISLDTLTLQSNALVFRDRSVEPNSTGGFEELSGTIKDLTSRSDVRAVVDLSGRHDAHSPFHLAGTVQPLTRDLFLDLKASATNIDLGAVSPYAGKFAGYPIKRGKLSTELAWHIENRTLAASNSVTIHQFTFGPKTGSTNATKLPVKLGVALLTDLNGNIELNLPVEGSFDDPKFRIGQIVWSVVENILVKAATAPFRLLGSLFGGGEEELGFVEFTPGATEFDTAGTNRLDKVAELFAQRPLLNLELSGQTDAEADPAALARARLTDQLKALRVQELVTSGKPAVPLRELKLTPNEYERLLKKQFQTALTVEGKKPRVPKKDASGLSALEKMEQELMAQMEISNNDLGELQQARAQTVQIYLLTKPGLTPERVYLAHQETSTNTPPARRVTLTLD